MARAAQIKKLEDRKRQLVAQSARYRQEIAGEIQNLQTAAAWVDTGYTLVRSVRSFWPLIAPIAGLLIARKRRPLVRLLGRGLLWFRLGKKLAGSWSRRSSDATTAEESF